MAAGGGAVTVKGVTSGAHILRSQIATKISSIVKDAA